MAASKTHVEDYTTKPFVRKVIDYSIYLVFRVIERIILVIPHKQGRKIGRFLGWVIYWLDARHRRVAMKNLRMAFSAEKSPKEIRDIGRKSFMHLCETATDLRRSCEMTGENMDDYFDE